MQVSGLSHSRYGELLEFENNSYGLALDLRLDGVGAVLLSGAEDVPSGSIVRGTGRVADIGVGEALLGRVVESYWPPAGWAGAASGKIPAYRGACARRQ